MKICEVEDSDCVTKRTTETNMQGVPCAAAIVSAGRHYTHQSLPKSAELPSVSLLRAQSHTAMDYSYKKINEMHYLYFPTFIFGIDLYMFRQYLCPSSGV
jgi:hypothetical protein